jgi:hypothetical protein
VARSRGSRAVLAQIDARLAELDRDLERARELLVERRRLVSARAALTGERLPVSGSMVRRVTQDELAEFLAVRPGSRAAVIARELGVPLTNISQHLHRGRETRFERQQDGWYLRDTPEAGS